MVVKLLVKMFSIQSMNKFGTLAEPVAWCPVKLFLWISQYSQENNFVRVSFLIKLQTFFHRTFSVTVSYIGHWPNNLRKSWTEKFVSISLKTEMFPRLTQVLQKL